MTSARAHAPTVVGARLDGSAVAWDSVATSRNARLQWSIDAGGTLAPRGFYDPTITNLGDYQGKLGLTWPLTDGGRRARARERSGLDVAASRWRTALVAREAGVEAARLATRMLRLQSAVAFRREAVGWFDRLATLVQSAVTAGVRSSSDSIRVALERDAAVAALEDVQLEMRGATLDLLNTLGRERDTVLAIRVPWDAAEREPGPGDSTRLMATVDQRPEVQLGRVAETLVRLDLLETEHRSSPTVELAADAGLAGADLTRAVPENLRAADPGANLGDRLRRDMGASVAVRLHFPVLDASVGPAVEARRDALSAARARSVSESVAQRRIATALLDQWSTAARRLAAAELTGRRAERNLLRVKSLYSGGATSLFDLLDAWRAYRDAREHVEDAREQYRLMRFQAEDRR